jgi:hypothetical protein
MHKGYNITHTVYIDGIHTILVAQPPLLFHSFKYPFHLAAKSKQSLTKPRFQKKEEPSHRYLSVSRYCAVEGGNRYNS